MNLEKSETQNVIIINPEDERNVFYEKLIATPIEQLENAYKCFDEKSKILECYLRLKKNPQYNVDLVYEGGWHFTFCEGSYGDCLLPPPPSCSCLNYLMIHNRDDELMNQCTHHFYQERLFENLKIIAVSGFDAKVLAKHFTYFDINRYDGGTPSVSLFTMDDLRNNADFMKFYDNLAHGALYSTSPYMIPLLCKLGFNGRSFYFDLFKNWMSDINSRYVADELIREFPNYVACVRWYMNNSNLMHIKDLINFLCYDVSNMCETVCVRLKLVRTRFDCCYDEGSHDYEGVYHEVVSEIFKDFQPEQVCEIEKIYAGEADLRDKIPFYYLLEKENVDCFF